ncbi:MAG: glycosyltransferase [Bdellovibrionales bacterium]|nr:glycosyltransferase [Bdellovibrionales bacterium]
MTPYPLRVLLILLEPPLPFGNAASRWFHVLYQELLKREHKVTVLVASGLEKDIQKAKEQFSGNEYDMQIFPFAKSSSYKDKLNHLLYPHRNKFSADFMAALKKVRPDSFDIIHIEQTWAGWTALPWSHKALINVHHLQTIDLQYVKARGWKQNLLYKRWFHTEKKLLSRYPYVRTCSPRLEPYIQSWGKKKIVKTVPVGMDSSLYPFIPSEQRQTEKPILTLIGNMGWYPSVSAAIRLLEHLWPQIKEQVPEARCRIVGWSAKSALKNYLDLPGVEIYENVPDIQPYFNQASAMLYAPSRGSGMKIKILESMLFGVPVITTSEGAEGLPAEDMVHCGLCEDNEGLIQRTVEILRSPELQEKIRLKARQLVEEHCGPQSTVDQIENLYCAIIKQS